MYLVELFIPLANNDGVSFPRGAFMQVEQVLTDRFGGLTSYPRAPASGLWGDSEDSTRDDLLIYEVMTELLDKQWWDSYRKTLERQFQQEKVLIRAKEIMLL